MKNFIAIIIFILLFVGIYYKYGDLIFYKPCAKPIPYTIGTFDTRFNISKDNFIKDIKDAEAVWESSSNKDLFVYEPNNTDRDTLKINLVYDYRQATTKSLNQIGAEVDQNKASYDAMKADLERMKRDLASEKAQFEAKLAAWNRGPRNNKAEYEELRTMQEDLNDKVDDINNLISKINTLAQKLNLSAEKFNTINDARGESFEEGLYSTDGYTHTIDIYEFESRTKLVRVLAHEFGHALGLSHVAGASSIMYEVNSGTNLNLSVNDLKALQTLCDTK